MSRAAKAKTASKGSNAPRIRKEDHVLTLIGAIKDGDSKRLQVEYDKLPLRDSFLCSTAAGLGQLECLKILRKNGCPWSEDLCYIAAGNGQLACLKWAHENGCSWNRFTCSSAASNGHLDCLKYAHENKCDFDGLVLDSAAGDGKLDCLKYGYENGLNWTKDCSFYAACGGHLDCLKYMHDNGCPLAVDYPGDLDPEIQEYLDSLQQDENKSTQDDYDD
jgi:hypothetical protein